MSIAKYIKEIGRGREGARSLQRDQAHDLMGQLLDETLSDLEVGAFCIAMRIKGESPAEMAGFLDALHARLNQIEAPRPFVILPSYNGARKLPGLTCLLAALLAREGIKHGFEVMIHGCQTENSRVSTEEVFRDLEDALNFPGSIHRTKADRGISQTTLNSTHYENLSFVPTASLHSGLKALLEVRRTVGLRNSAHSLVKLMNPTTHPQSLVVSSYTHPEYLQSMTATLALTNAHALLLRGTEGEPVADPRRMPKMDGFAQGHANTLEQAQPGTLQQLPQLPTTNEALASAQFTVQVLKGQAPVPVPIARQVECIVAMMRAATKRA